MTIKYCRVLIVAIISGLLISGCAGIFKSSPLSVDQTSIAEIRHRVEQNYLKFHALKAKAVLSLESPQMSFMANSTIHLKKPDSVKIKLTAGFGLNIGSVFLDNKQFLLYNSFENTLYSGCPDSINFREFLPVDIKIENFLQIFSGIQSLKSLEHEILSVDKKQFLVSGAYENGAMKFWIDPKNFVVTKYQLIDSDNNILIQFEYKTFLNQKNVRQPKTIRIFQPEKKTRLTLVFSNTDVNPRMNENDFIIKMPENVKKIQLSEKIKQFRNL
jgi:outer membrane lipoprotein-sorting protein